MEIIIWSVFQARKSCDTDKGQNTIRNVLYRLSCIDPTLSGQALSLTHRCLGQRWVINSPFPCSAEKEILCAVKYNAEPHLLKKFTAAEMFVIFADIHESWKNIY